MRKRITRKAVVASGAVAVIAVALVFGLVRPGFGSVGRAGQLSGAERAALSRMSSRGVPVAVPPAAAAALAQAGYRRSAVLLATRGDERFFRFENGSPEKRDCLGIGRVGDATLYRAIMCRVQAPFFPSPEMPLLDVSVVEITNDNPTPHYIRVAGFAADGVAAVGILNAAGDVVEKVPVEDDVYYSATVPLGSVARLVAIDAAGNVVGRAPSN